MTPRPGPRGAEERLRRLLVMLPWLMERDAVPVAEAAARFDLSETQVVKDLELVAMCGLPPFVDEMIDVFIDEGMIWVGVPRLFTKPLRLTTAEAWTLLSAGRAAMELPGADPDGPLGRGLAKLASALGEHDTTGVRIDLDRPELAGRLADAVTGGEELAIVYWSASTDETTERRIVPRLVFTDRGEWYVTADDDRSGARRTFRIDRIHSIEPTGRRVGPPDVAPTPGEWFAGESVRRATLRLDAPAHWVIERYPVDEVGPPDEDGAVEVILPVASERWLAALLLRLGPSARVVGPAELADVGRDAARRVLGAYRS